MDRQGCRGLIKDKPSSAKVPIHLFQRDWFPGQIQDGKALCIRYVEDLAYREEQDEIAIENRKQSMIELFAGINSASSDV